MTKADWSLKPGGFMPRELIIGVASFVVPFLVSLSYPITILSCLPKASQRERWIQNNPSFSIFLLSSYPIAVCIFSVTVKAEVISYWFEKGTWHSWISVAAIVLTVPLITFLVIHDFTRRPVAPYILKKALVLEATRLEGELRAAKKGGSQSKNLQAIRNQYQKMVQLASLKDLFRRGGPCAYVHLAMAWTATLFSLVYFWYLIFLLLYSAIHGAKVDTADNTKLVLVFLLLATWFPMRLHTEWYQNHFYRKHWLKEYPAFWTLGFLALALLVLVIFVNQRQGIIVVLWILPSVIGAILGLLGKFKPEWLHSVADFLQSTPFVYFVAMYLIFFIVVSAVSSAAIWFPH